MGLNCETNYCNTCPLQEIEDFERRKAVGKLTFDVIKWHNGLQWLHPEDLRKVIWEESCVVYFAETYTSEDIEIVARILEAQHSGDCQTANQNVNIN